MVNPTATRAQLKLYFAKNCIPTESNFSDLIDGMLNQTDDGIFKTAGDPLCIAAAMDTNSSQKAINLYASVNDVSTAAPAWIIQLNPRSSANDPATARQGFSISDANGSSCLFIDKFNKNLGIGTVTPTMKLDINGGANVGGALNVAGVATLNTTLTVTGAATLNDALTVTGAATLNGVLTVGGAATLSGLTVNGTTTFNNAVGLSGTAGLTVNGVVTVGTQLSVHNNSVYAGLDPNNPKNLRILGFHTDNGDDVDAGKIAYRPSWNGGVLALTGAGATGARRIALYDAVEVAGTLTVDGDQAANGALNVGGLTTCKGGLTVNGAANFNGDASVGGTLTVRGGQVFPKVQTFRDQICANQGKDAPGVWSVSLTGFRQVYTAYVMFQGYSIWPNFNTGNHNETDSDIVQLCYVKITNITTTAITGTSYCSESDSGNESNNLVMFTLVVIGI